MFGRIKEKYFEKQVLNTIQRELINLLGKERGEESIGMFATAILNSQEHDNMPRDLLAQLRKSGLNVNEVAVAYLDAAVTACKRVLQKAGGSSPDIDAVIADMERGIDHMFLAKPSTRILPRNGKVGKGLSEFAHD